MNLFYMIRMITKRKPAFQINANHCISKERWEWNLDDAGQEFDSPRGCTDRPGKPGV